MLPVAFSLVACFARCTPSFGISGFPRKILRKLKPAASNKQQQHVVVSVDDVAAALKRISSTFADAPKPVERVGVVSLTAKIYAEGAAFADNQPRCCEAVRPSSVTTLVVAHHACVEIDNVRENRCRKQATVDGNACLGVDMVWARIPSRDQARSQD